ncbi:MAG: PH domain-containing protein [Eggerthellaceae bacterium]|nr:PH domain-containing protein [Eggerthellaceae bacterium]
MREMPANQLNPKMKNVWRISDSIWIVLAFLCCFVPVVIAAALLPEERSWILLVLLGELIVFGALVALFVIILPPIRFARWRYEVSADYLDIAKGIIWRKRYIIPFIRVQNTDTKQGPILRAFGLASVTVSTAAGEHEIPGLAIEEAELLRDRAAELARLAREDV